MKKWAYSMITLGAILWGIIGFFVQGLYQLGLNSLQIVTVRLSTAAIILLTIVFLKDKSLLKIRFKDWPYFIGTGILSFALFNWFYFIAIKELSLSIAVILLYTSPIFVALLSFLFLGEKFTGAKVISLILTFIGIGFVIGLFPNMEEMQISFYGFLVGIGSGLGHALYSIFGKAALKRYDSLTIITYTFVFASVAILPFSKLWSIKEVFYQTDAWLLTLGLAIFPTALALFFYTMGLSYVESSRAAIIATIEPVVASLLGIIVYKDNLSLWQVLGMFLVIGAVILVQERNRQGKKGSVKLESQY